MLRSSEARSHTQEDPYGIETVFDALSTLIHGWVCFRDLPLAVYHYEALRTEI